MLLFAVNVCLRAQTCAPGELRIFVVDSQEAPVVEAQVHIATGVASLASRPTDTEGFTDFTGVPCASWEVTASKEGFETTAASVKLGSAGNLELTVVLNPKRQTTSVDVTETQPPVEQSAAQNNELRPADVQNLPTNPATIDDALPLEPGVVRGPDGELKIDGAGQERSAMVVNQSDITDPATGKFVQAVPVDAIETVNVLNAPFLAQYGRFTQSVIAVETRRGGEKWHVGLNDPFPDFRIRSDRMVGIRNETPRFVLGGPLIKGRLYFISSLQYILDKVPNRTLYFPKNVSKQQTINSFTQLDYILTDKQILTATFHWTPQQINYVNPNYFNPQPATPSYAQQNYTSTLLDRWGLFNGLLDSSVSVQQFDATIGAQGNADLVLMPQGNLGNFFGTQTRIAKRTEWLETWSLAPFHLGGTHQVKMGSSLTDLSDRGHFDYRPIDIENAAGLLEERITFSNLPQFNRTDLEVTAYAQDHWSLNSRLSIDYGARIEHQRLAGSLRIAPRVGFAWSPFADQKTVFRAGYGTFFDHLPMDIYVFGRYPLRTITYYASDGSVIGDPVPYENVIGSINGPRSFLVQGGSAAGEFSPRGATLNLQLEHSFTSYFRARAVYTDNRAVGLVVLDPEPQVQQIVLNGDGQSRYRQLEISGKFTWKSGQQFNATYTHSRSEGSLNTFDTFLGNFPTALVRPDVYGNLPADVPNRLLLWGRLKSHVWDIDVLPLLEFHTGFPYATLDAMQNYVGIPYSDATRFPDFFSADARLMKDLKVNAKYTLRVSLTGFNLSNHFNALAVHNNIADPQYETFFGNYHRRYRFDFEVLF
jgi:Carboxypeptidase regulatory-like domain